MGYDNLISKVPSKKNNYIYPKVFNQLVGEQQIRPYSTINTSTSLINEFRVHAVRRHFPVQLLLGKHSPCWLRAKLGGEILGATRTLAVCPWSTSSTNIFVKKALATSKIIQYRVYDGVYLRPIKLISKNLQRVGLFPHTHSIMVRM